MTHHIAAFVATVLVGSAAHGQAVFSQRPTDDPNSIGYGFYSHSHPTTFSNYKHADGFTLTDDSILTGVRWWGNSSGNVSEDLDNVLRFTVEIFTGDFLPDQLIFTQTYDLLDTDPVNTGRYGQQNSWEYMHEVSFALPVPITSGAGHMIAISAGLENSVSGDRWSWEDANLNDAVAASYSWASGNWSVILQYDSAFELLVPAPGVMTMLVACLLASPRRRRP